MAREDVTQTTYKINQEGSDGRREHQVFTDPKAAGEAWFKADMAKTPMVMIQEPGERAKLYAGTGVHEGKPYKDLPFDNAPGASDFKASFKGALELSKKEHAGTAAGKPSEPELAKSKPMDMPAYERAVAGKTYDGKVVGFKENQVIQQIVNGDRVTHIAHDRSALSSAKSGLVHPGKDLSIRYPFAGVGIVKDRQLQHEQKVPSHQPKGFGGIGKG